MKKTLFTTSCLSAALLALSPLSAGAELVHQTDDDRMFKVHPSHGEGTRNRAEVVADVKATQAQGDTVFQTNHASHGQAAPAAPSPLTRDAVQQERRALTSGLKTDLAHSHQN